MRRSLVICLAALLVVGSVSVAAADVIKGELMLAPRGGGYIPLGNYPIGGNFAYLNDKVRPGFGFGALVDKAATQKLSFGFEVGYNVSKIDAAELQDALKRQGVLIKPDFKWTTIELTVHARYHMRTSQPLSFFGHLGAGLYANKLSTDLIQTGTGGIQVDLPSSQTLTRFGINVGPGLLLRTGPYTRISLEAILHNVFSPGQMIRYLNITASLVFSLPPE
jgi:hypothetical protein